MKQFSHTEVTASEKQKYSFWSRWKFIFLIAKVSLGKGSTRCKVAAPSCVKTVNGCQFYVVSLSMGVASLGATPFDKQQGTQRNVYKGLSWRSLSLCTMKIDACGTDAPHVKRGRESNSDVNGKQSSSVCSC